MTGRIAVSSALAVLALAAGVATARAQMPSMPGMPGMNMGGGMGLPSVTSAAPGNLAGVLGFCVQNNYLGASTASPVMSALGQKTGTDSSQYQAGQRGLLDTGNGRTFSLAGAGQGIKQQMTQKVCNQVLSRAQSLL
ncbi:YjjA family protein [Gluconacetobacter tumulisoli]|uniref:YjjA family protein n=1 Tax=Gluconacetobacter tumulisoli TaxID=1286189 RepID=A0A7W4K7V7_9PROT|nr:YjjA family protein [Gluconacetobacter tumulisoli]MBB2201988.1 YjjA family protein [Gluconacetobacter tumulisoli]